MADKVDKVLVGTDRKTEKFKTNVAAEIAIAQFRQDVENLGSLIQENRYDMKWLSEVVRFSGFADNMASCLIGYGFISEEMLNFSRKYSNWFKNNQVVYEASEYENKELRERVNELSLINLQLSENLKSLESDRERLKELELRVSNLEFERDFLEAELVKQHAQPQPEPVSFEIGEELSGLLEFLKAQSGQVGEMLELFKNNKASMLTSEFMRSEVYKNQCKDRKGKNSPRYRQDAPDETIIKEFQNGSTVQQLAQLYNMTENGIREKLKRAGVWENRRKKGDKSDGYK